MTNEQTTMETTGYDDLGPFLAAVRGRDEDERWLLFAAFSSLSEEQRGILVDPKTIEQIKQWSSAGLFPPTHIPAISKLIGLLALDTDVHMPEVPQILEKLGLSTDQAKQLTNNISNLLQPIFLERAKNEAADSMEQLSPMTRPTEMGPQSLVVKIPSLPENTGASASTRNIIDLRKQPPSA
jgi:hypothetical protein